MGLDKAREYQKLQINELEEIRNDAYESARIYKDKTKSFNDKMISRKDFINGNKSSYSIHASNYFCVNYALIGSIPLYH